MRTTQTLLAVTFFVSATVWAFDRENTDLVTLRNGDRVTGEIVSLEYGVLRLKTSDMGTLSIEWPAVKAIDSRYSFYVESTAGQHLYGTVAAAERDDTLLIRDEVESTQLRLAEIARISQVETSFWRRFSGSLALGYNFTKSSDVATTSFSFDTTYRSERIEGMLTASSLTTKSPDGTTDRDLIATTVRFRRQGPTFWQLLSSLERNEEIGIDGRIQAGVAFGRRFIQRSDSELTGFIGVAFNQEWATSDEDSQQTVEGVLGSQWRIFRFNDPETSLASSFIFYPSLSQSGRRRAELNVTLSRELIEDLTFDVSLYDSYDNEPPDEAAQTSDYGIVTSLGYKF